MSELGMGLPDALPAVSDKNLHLMNQLMADRRYAIKPAATPFHVDRAEKVSPEFVLYTLNDFLGHIQNCVACTKKILPHEYENPEFFGELRRADRLAFDLVEVIREIDLKQLSLTLHDLQKNPRDVSLGRLVPFVRLLFRSLLRVYYLGHVEIAKRYRSLFSVIMRQLVPADVGGLRNGVANAITEWQFVFERVIPGLYPLVLRMTSSVMLDMHQLFYANGSKVLAWTGLTPADILIARGDEPAPSAEPLPAKEPDRATAAAEEADGPPEGVVEGLRLLDRLFPEAGWLTLESMPDMCGYFQPILQFQDAFTQLAPENPLHQTMILFWILEEFFQGLRQIKFEALDTGSIREDSTDINSILDGWIVYQVNEFDKVFSVDLKAYTHQVYTQPDFGKTPYGRKLLANMYTHLKAMYLPWFNIRLYGSVKAQRDDRHPPFYTRVSQLTALLSRYSQAIEAAGGDASKDPEASIPGILNPWAPYKFDIANNVSKRLDLLLGVKHSRQRTNAALLQATLAVLRVLDWWINDRDSYAYLESPEYLYRVIEPGSPVPAFGVKPRTDVDQLFLKTIKSPSATL